MKKLDKIMYPKSVALVGASEKEGSVGNELLKRMTEFSFTGEIYPVNMKHEQIMGLKCYHTLSDIKKDIDLVVIAVPAKVVEGVIDECHSVGVKNVIIISSGFKEVGGDGAVMEHTIKSKIEQYDINVIGPNCLGVFNADKSVSFDGCFAPTLPKVGKVGFATQSGALATGVFNISSTLRIGFSQMISLGNQMDVDALDVIEQWGNDDNVSQILLYLESIKEPKKFRNVATKIAQKKPILAIKSGRSPAGAKAAASHTGSLAGSDSACAGLLASCGVVREFGLREMFNSAQVLGNCALPKGNRLGILTNAGGPGILATDSASDEKIAVPTLSEELQNKLKEITLPQASRRNPVDLVASASVEHYRNVADAMLASGEIDMLLVIYLYITGKNDMAILQNMEELKKKYPNKPIITVYMTTPDFDERIEKEMPNSTIPVFDYVTDAVHGFRLLLDRKEFLENINKSVPKFAVDKNKVDSIFTKARDEERTLLTTKESLEVFKAYGLPMPKFDCALTLSEAKKIAENIGYPIVLKMSSKTVSHKTDIGGVVVGIKNEDDLTEKWNDLKLKLEKADVWKTLDGVIVMQQVNGGGREFVAGVSNNGNFGHQIMFGIGGIFVESLKEVAFRPCPLTMRDVDALIDGTKAKALLGDVRGKKGVDINVVKEALLRLSQLVTDFGDISELDVNPFMLDNDGNFLTVDARIVINQE